MNNFSTYQRINASTTLLVIEQCVAQALQSTFLVGLADEEGDVVVATSVRNHADGDVLHGLHGEGFETDVLPCEVAHHAADSLTGMAGTTALHCSAALKQRCSVSCDTNGRTPS